MSLRLLWHSNAPWVPTGYGQQTELFAPRFKAMGHEVAISAFYGLSGMTVNWNDIPVFPSGMRPNSYGMDMVLHHAEQFQADATIILADAWVGQKCVESLRQVPGLANWIPIDTATLSEIDDTFLRTSGSIPIAMSRHGHELLVNAGHDALYAPHGIDTDVFVPLLPEGRQQIREALGFGPDTIVIGMNAANRDLVRKGFFEQFEAFRRFHADHPDSKLYVHTMMDHPNGLDLMAMATTLGIQDALYVPDQCAYAAGSITPTDLAIQFYNVIDVYSGCSYGEGFGIPLLEAQSCGVPVVTTNASAMAELCAPESILVDGEPVWVPGHKSTWTKPRIRDIVRAYETLSQMPPGVRQSLREFAMDYHVDNVASQHWEGVLKALEDRL